jgi:hypothetical protein
MPDYSTSFAKFRAYNVTPDTLASIVNAAKKFIEASPTITVYLEDDHNIEDTNLDALVADSFVRGKQIKRITIDGRKTLFDPLVNRSISVNFEVDLLHVAEVRIAGERDRSLAARREIETILEGAETWYAPMFWPRSMLLFQLSIFIPIIASIALGVLVTWLLGAEIRKDFVSGWTVVPVAAFVSAYFGLKNRLFPKLTFDIGRSASRIQSARYWRNFLLTSILVGIVLKLAIDHILK